MNMACVKKLPKKIVDRWKPYERKIIQLPVCKLWGRQHTNVGSKFCNDCSKISFLPKLCSETRCDNYTMTDREICYLHSCKIDGCQNNRNRCFKHRCIYIGIEECSNIRVNRCLRCINHLSSLDFFAIDVRSYGSLFPTDIIKYLNKFFNNNIFRMKEVD